MLNFIIFSSNIKLILISYQSKDYKHCVCFSLKWNEAQFLVMLKTFSQFSSFVEVALRKWMLSKTGNKSMHILWAEIPHEYISAQSGIYSWMKKKIKGKVVFKSETFFKLAHQSLAGVGMDILLRYWCSPPMIPIANADQNLCSSHDRMT